MTLAPLHISITLVCVVCKHKGLFQIHREVHEIKLHCQRCAANTRIIRVVDAAKVVLRENACD